MNVLDIYHAACRLIFEAFPLHEVLGFTQHKSLIGFRI